MRVGVPKEVKVHEYRVAATPDLVRILVDHGHEVCIQTQAGHRIGYTDELYRTAGGKIVETAAEVYQADLILKVKEPQPQEIPFIREGQVLFCYLHLAAAPELTKALLERKCIGISYDTVTDREGHLPLLVPMSEIAGRMAIQVGATALQMNNGGCGVLLGGVPGTPRGKVVILGGGVAGTEAARMAVGLGAKVTVIDKNIVRLRELDRLFEGRVTMRYSTPETIETCVLRANLVVGAVLIAGKKTPLLITRKMVAQMRPGSVIVDIAIDQGGCCETSKPTTHDNPTYVVDGVIHYCVTNMPGSCARTATQALTNATGDFALALAQKGWKRALQEDAILRSGLNVCLGEVTNRAVAEDLHYPYVSAEMMFA